LGKTAYSTGRPVETGLIKIQMIFRNLILTGLIIGISVVSCRKPPAKPLREPNLADVYNPGKTTLHPDFTIHHVNDSATVLYIRILPSELLFSMAYEDNISRARIRIKYELRHISETSQEGVLRDSASIYRNINRTDAKAYYFTALPLKVYSGNKYFLIVNVYDENRRTRNQSSLILDKTTRFTAQNYKVISPKTGYPLFNRNFSPGEQFRIIFNQLGFDSIHVDFFNPDRNMPHPMFSTLPEAPLKTQPDSSWSYSYNDSMRFELIFPGTYIFRVDKQYKEGLTLMNFGEHFPSVRTPDDLLGPLIYLTSSTEFRDIRMELNRKLAVDNFWIGVAGTMEGARELIRVFYTRVLFANLYFTSYKEGWKTDRGMIYIVFGAPNMLDITPNNEKWTYFTGKGSNPIEFIFERKENIFTHADYQYIREVNSNPYWRSAVQSWRKGKIYSSIN